MVIKIIENIILDYPMLPEFSLLLWCFPAVCYYYSVWRFNYFFISLSTLFFFFIIFILLACSKNPDTFYIGKRFYLGVPEKFMKLFCLLIGMVCLYLSLSSEYTNVSLDSFEYTICFVGILLGSMVIISSGGFYILGCGLVVLCIFYYYPFWIKFSLKQQLIVIILSLISVSLYRYGWNILNTEFSTTHYVPIRWWFEQLPLKVDSQICQDWYLRGLKGTFFIFISIYLAIVIIPLYLWSQCRFIFPIPFVIFISSVPQFGIVFILVKGLGRFFLSSFTYWLPLCIFFGLVTVFLVLGVVLKDKYFDLNISSIMGFGSVIFIANMYIFISFFQASSLKLFWGYLVIYFFTLLNICLIGFFIEHNYKEIFFFFRDWGALYQSDSFLALVFLFNVFVLYAIPPISGYFGCYKYLLFVFEKLSLELFFLTIFFNLAIIYLFVRWLRKYFGNELKTKFELNLSSSFYLYNQLFIQILFVFYYFIL